MGAAATKTDPELWDRVKAEITAGDKGGAAGQWSARKAQMAVQAYRAQGGAYKGRKSADNHLAQWTREDWGTRSGHDSRETGERYLPKEARDALTPAEYARTSRKKRADMAEGHQFSQQPADVARKTAPFRHGDAPAPSKAVLYAAAKARDIPGRSRMTRDQLAAALAHHGGAPR